MTNLELKRILACPSCKNRLFQSSDHKKNCPSAKKSPEKIDNIWDFSSFNTGKSFSLDQNELMHQKGPWHRISDGSYEILASFARGNKTVDIACGDGYIEQLAPETVGVDFSISALKKAKKNGAKYLVCASAENLPFIDNSFDLSISAGSLENIESPQKAIFEMARVSKIQIMTVHREFDIPTIRMARSVFTQIANVAHQPVEKPLRESELQKMLEAAKLKIVFKGFWTLPVNYGKIIKFLPVFKNIPSCFFVITIKK